MEKIEKARDTGIEYLVDHQKIKDVLIRYAVAIDTKNWTMLKSCFSSDGEVDYGPDLGRHAGPDAIAAVVKSVLDCLDATHHLTGNYQIRIEGDEASCASYLHAQHIFLKAPSGHAFTLGGIYHDTLARTADGWKIRHRRLEIIWTTGNAELIAEAAGAK